MLWFDPFTMAAVDRLVHHAIILEFDGETQRTAEQKAKGGSQPGAPSPPRLRYVLGACRRQGLRSTGGVTQRWKTYKTLKRNKKVSR